MQWNELIASAGEMNAPLPKGVYDCVVDDASAGRSSTDKLMFKVRFKVVSGPHAGRTIFNNITLTPDNPRALGMFFVNMKALGLDRDFFATNPSEEAVAGAMIGKAVTATVDHREWQGEMRDNVKSFKARQGEVPGVMPVAITVPASVPQLAAQPVPAPTADVPTAPPTPPGVNF